MAEEDTKLENTGEKVERNPDGTLKQGAKLNPAGKPKGTLSFITKWRNVVEKLAEKNNISVDEVDEQLILMAYGKAKAGDFSYYRDTMDRIHGKPKESIGHTLEGGITITFDNAFDKKDDTPSIPKENSQQ